MACAGNESWLYIGSQKHRQHILPSKRPWAPEIHGSKSGAGHLHREAINFVYDVKSSQQGLMFT